MRGKNFFSILYLVCSGTKVFSELIEIGYLRAAWHLILLAVVCSSAFSLGNVFYLKKEIVAACTMLNAEFGGISIEDNKIFPKLKREKAHQVEYQSFLLDYMPQLKDMDNLNLDLDAYNSGIIWTPDSVTGWMKINNKEIIVYPALSSLADMNLFAICPANYISNYIKLSPKFTDAKNLALKICVQGDIPVVGVFLLRPVDNFETFIPSLLKWSSVVTMLRFLIVAVLNVFFYALVFALIYRFTAKNDYINYTFKNFFIAAIYAAFPAIVIGTLLSIAQTQWIDYSTVFIIVFVIYLFFILNNLKLNAKRISK